LVNAATPVSKRVTLGFASQSIRSSLGHYNLGARATFVEIGSDHLHGLLAEWQHYNHWDCPHHRSHKSKTPMERCYLELSDATPFSKAVYADGQSSKEGIQT
jgi:hypothetical protein